MLGRKQSIRVDMMASDYVQDESLNETAEIDWVNKVTKKKYRRVVVLSERFCIINVTSRFIFLSP